MTEKEILKGNKLIAEFMEFEDGPADSFSENNYRLPDCYRAFMHCSHFGRLLFYDNWSWLMPVVEKIWNITGNRASIFYFELEDQHKIFFSKHNYTTCIEDCYGAVIEFINWYNKEMKTNE